MENIKIIENFEREINKLDDVVNKPTTEDSLFWLNQAIAKFTKLRFNGDFVHYTGFEETEKRRSDLIRLFKTVTYTFRPTDINNDGLVDTQDQMVMYNAMRSGKSVYDGKEDVNKDGLIDTQDQMLVMRDLGTTSIIQDTSHSDYDSYLIPYPENFLYALNEDVVITDVDGSYEKGTCVFECTRDSFMYRVNNSLTDFHYRNHRARPLRIRTKDGCELLTDKKYIITKYVLGYLKTPDELSLENPNDEYPDFQDSTLYEIIKMAAQMYLENQGEERYKSLTQEVLTQE